MNIPHQVRRTIEIEEFTNRYFIHPISGWLVPRFHRLDIHPNTVSLTGALAGVLAGVCYAYYGHLGAVIAGFALMIVWHVMDGADGQLARLSGKVTASGYVIDGICDYVTFIVIYVALANRLSTELGGWIWIVVVAAGLSHIVQSAAFELQRAAYNQWAGGKAFAPAAAAAAQRATRGQASPFLLFRLLAQAYASIQEPFQPVDVALRHRLLHVAHSSPDGSTRVAEKYRDIFRTAVLRWSWLSANNRTIAIFIACLIGHPMLYFLHEMFILNYGLFQLVRMNQRRTAMLAAWADAQTA
jgi:phosphatidylglycerophosphate synthase